MTLPPPTHILLFTLALATSHPAIARVYKCTAPDGKVYYTDSGCDATADQHHIDIDRAPTPPPRPVMQPSADPLAGYPAMGIPPPTEPVAPPNPEDAIDSVDRARLSDIDNQLKNLEKREGQLKDTLRFAQGMREDWTREDLRKVHAKMEELYRQWEMILGRAANPCDFPWQRDSMGRRCGGRSAFSRPGGRYPEMDY